MAQNALFNVFVDLLKDLFDAENQIIENLPMVIKECSNPDLKNALSHHLDETKQQVQRLKRIFKMLNENPTGVTCKGMQSIFAEGDKLLKQNLPPAVKDAGIIVACQTVEHYEMAKYGSARTIAHHLSDAGLDERLDFDEIADLLQETLDEESAADEKLTDLAEGGFFKTGINEEAEKEMPSTSTPRRRSTKR